MTVVQQPRPAHRHHDDREKRDEPDEGAREEIDAEDRRVPVRRERHDPVDRGEGLGQREDDDGGAGEAAQAGRHPGIPGHVLPARAAVVEEGDEGPDAEVERRPDQEERHVEVRRLPAKQRIVLGCPGDGPRVEIAQTEEQREEQGRHHGERCEDRLPDPSHHDPPSSLGRVLDQHEEERAEGEAQKEQERHEPREEELLRIRRPQDRAGHRPQQGADGANDRNAVPRRAPAGSWPARAAARRDRVRGSFRTPGARRCVRQGTPAASWWPTHRTGDPRIRSR